MSDYDCIMNIHGSLILFIFPLCMVFSYVWYLVKYPAGHIDGLSLQLSQ